MGSRAVWFMGAVALIGATARSAALPPGAEAWLAQHSAALRAAWAARVAQNPSLAANVVDPSVTAGKILTPVVDVLKAPGLPTVQLTLASGTVGVSEVLFMIAPVSGTGTFFSQPVALPIWPPEPKHETLPFLLQSEFGPGFGLYAANQDWTINSLMVYANDGTVISYSGTQLAALFPSLTISVQNSGTPDTEPPKVISGALLTPTVSLSSPKPDFVATIKALDNLSGVSSVSVTLQPPDGNFPVGAYGVGTAPALRATLGAVYQLSSTSPTGTWLITGYQACDFAANCFSDNNAADVQKLFGTTTFQVTN